MNLIISKKNVFYIFLCLIVALLVSFIPWDLLNPRGYFIDREGYIFGYEYKRYRLDDFSAVYYYDYITNEWLWRYLMGYTRNSLNISSYYFFGFITFFGFFSYGLFIVSKTKNIYSLVYLFNPVFISFIYSQLRLAFAMSIFLTAIYFYNKKIYLFSIFLFCCSLLIHTSMFLFLSFLLISIFIAKARILILNKFLLVVFSGLLLNLIIGPLRYTILSGIGDRRAEYNDMSSPTLYFIIYVVYFFINILLIFKYNLKYFNNYMYNYAFIMFSFIFFSLFLGGYTSRFIAAAQCFIVITLFLLKGKLGSLFHLGYILYLFALWVSFLT